MSGASKRVLIVEDNQELRSSLQSALRERGHEADAASDGAVALDLARRVDYDLVVTDLRMPALDGPTLLAALREAGEPPPVIVVTGYATLDAAIDCLRKGAVDFLVKPFAVEDFLSSVETALERLPPRPERLLPDREWLRREFCLTPRQAEILEAFATTGESNRELAARLCLSEDTVKSHLRAAYQKVGVTNRAQLFLKLRERKAPLEKG